jgi:hypothetical protein
MRVTCPNCRSVLPSSSINLEWMTAKCDDCSRLFDCSQQLAELSPALPVEPLPQRAPVPLPEGMHMEVSGEREALLASNYRSESPNVTGTLKLERRWGPRTGVWFRVAFALFWCGSLVMMYDDVLRGGPVSLAVALLFTVVGVSLVHSVLAETVNISTITADAQTLTIHHGPVPVPGNKQIAVAGIEQLYCKEVIAEKEDSKSYSYSVMIRLTNGRELPLVEFLPRPEQALFIEQQLEAHLHITDVHIEGQL